MKGHPWSLSQRWHSQGSYLTHYEFTIPALPPPFPQACWRGHLLASPHGSHHPKLAGFSPSRRLSSSGYKKCEI